MTCQQPECTRRGELACVVGEIRKVLCIEHQARFRQAMSCGGRKIVVHHGVDLEEWTPPRPIRMTPVEDVPDLGFPLSSYVPPELVVELLPAAAMYSLSTALEQLDLSHTPPPPPPTPPTTLRVVMPVSRPLCLWPECESESKQGSCCMMHNDRLRKLYGSAARLTQAQIDAAPTAWEERMERRAAAARAQLAPVSKARVAAIVKARPVAAVPLVAEVSTVKATVAKAKEPDVAAAKILLNIARNLAAGQPDVQLMLDAAIMVLR